MGGHFGRFFLGKSAIDMPLDLFVDQVRQEVAG